MERLRDPDTGCPWDREQTLETIVPYTIEEAYEVADAIHRRDEDELRDELGDLLLQVVFYAQIAKEAGWFDFADVTAAICAKMERRHPHVFGDTQIADAEAQRKAWEAHKQAERSLKRKTGLLDGIARSLPALIRADKLQRRAANVGLDWDDVGGVLSKVREELRELEEALAEGAAARERQQDEVGDLLFSCVNLARHLGVAAEASLDAANRRFESRFRYIEAAVARAGSRLEDADPMALDRLWEEAKAREKDR